MDVRVDPCPQDPRRILKVLALVDEQHPARAHDGREGEIGRVPAECERGMRASWASARVRESCTEGFPMCEWLEWSAHSMAWSAASTRAAVRPAKPPPSTATRIFLVLGRAVPPPFARHGTRNASAPPSNRQCRAMLPPPTAGAMLGLRGLLSAFNSRDAEELLSLHWLFTQVRSPLQTAIKISDQTETFPHTANNHYRRPWLVLHTPAPKFTHTMPPDVASTHARVIPLHPLARRPRAILAIHSPAHTSQGAGLPLRPQRDASGQIHCP